MKSLTFLDFADYNKMELKFAMLLKIIYLKCANSQIIITLEII